MPTTNHPLQMHWMLGEGARRSLLMAIAREWRHAEDGAMAALSSLY